MRVQKSKSGQVLIMVLGYLALITVLVLTLVLIVANETNVAHNYSSEATAKIAEKGFAVQIVSDLQSQIASNSTVATVSQLNTYTPTTRAKMVPAISGFTYAEPVVSATGLENLIMVSNPALRASGISSNTASPEGTFESNSLWNKMLYLTPNSSTDSTPCASNFTAPDWIYCARDGTNPTTWNASYGVNGTNPVTQRYAYAIYNEGGMIDLNVAGCPVQVSGTTVTPIGSAAPLKNSLAYADLSQLPGLSSTITTINGISLPTLSGLQSASVINDIVGWRNYNSSHATGSIASSFTFQNPTVGLSFYDQYIRSNSNGFISTSGYNTNITQTDSSFTSRQQLIQFLKNCFTQLGLSTSNVSYLMQYVSHYSRNLNQPSYAPFGGYVVGYPKVVAGNVGANDLGGSTQKQVNPPFLSLTATSSFLRNDGSLAIPNVEPLVKSRFPLQRLAWLTYQGPSSTRNYANPASSSTSTDYDVYLLENNYSITPAYLAQGNAANIYKSFGLSWISDNRVDANGNSIGNGVMKWVYNHNLSNPAPGVTTSPVSSLTSASGTPIKTLAQVQLIGREPDFVELLKAAVCAGSIAKPGTTSGALSTQGGYQNAKDYSLDAAIIQLAANIIDQYDTDGVSTCILFNDGTWTADGITPAGEEYRGVEDMPYIYDLYAGFLPLVDSAPSTIGTQPNSGPGAAWAEPPNGTGPTLTNAGMGACIQNVVIWDPHSYSSTTPIGPRPTNFRMVAQDGPPYWNGPPAGGDPYQFQVQAYGRYSTSSTPPVPTSPYYPYQYPGAQACPLNTTPQHTVSLTPLNTELDFSIPTNRMDLFREPTILQKPGVPNGSNLATGKSHLINTDATLSAAGVNTGGYLKVQSPLAQGAMYQNVGQTDTMGYIGVYLGDFPLRWTSSTTQYIGTNPTPGSPPASQMASIVYTADYALVSGTPVLTYRMQAQNPATGQWVTYDEKYGNITYGGQTNAFVAPGIINLTSMSGWANKNEGDGKVYTFVDPRTARFGEISSEEAYNSTAATLNAPVIDRNYSGQGGYTNSYQASWAGIPGQYNQTSYGNAAIQNAVWTNRPDISSGFGYSLPTAALGFVSPSAFWRVGQICQNNPNSTCLDSQNRFSGSGIVGNQAGYNGGEPGTSTAPEYFADADGVVRRGMSGYLRPDNTVPLAAAAAPCLAGAPSGNPQNVANTFATSGVATPIASEVPSRPIILNRPFTTVAELGAVFSGIPWRNIDFLTPESGTAALLDVFCVNDETTNLTAGVVDLNTRQVPVLQALISGAYEDALNPTSHEISPTTGNASANVIASALVKRTSDTGATLGQGSGPLENITDLVGSWNSSVNVTGSTYIDGGQSYTGFSGAPSTSGTIPSSPPNLSYILAQDTSVSGYTLADIQRFRESAVRALAGAGQVRVWNLCIDMISQTGRFSSQAGSLSQFHVQAESRCLLHVAIDRYTGKVLDEQFENVNQ